MNPKTTEWLTVVALVAAAMTSPLLAQQEGSVNEHELKAALIYKIAMFVRWPETAFASRRAPIVIGVVGSDALVSQLAKTVAGKTATTRPFVAKRLNSGDSVEGYQIVFFAAGFPLGVQDFPELAHQPVLTIGETPEFARSGGVIGLIVAQNRVRFEINPQTAELARLELSSQLLSLARIVGQNATAQ